MSSFGKKISELRKSKKISQSELAKRLNTATSVIGRYERDEINPSIEAAKKLSKILDTTVGYLLGETNELNFFKNPDMLKRWNAIEEMGEKDKEHILFAIDALIQKVRLRNIAL
ncbi:MAG: helix-turn-helix transcriptional regulator [bacterium]|nr:helix-turn-helix transcriptional regulator [bacterium]